MGASRERRDQESRTRLCFSLSFFFDLPNTQGRGGRSGAGATQRTGDQGTGAIQIGAWGMTSGREMVAALGLEEKKTRIEHKVTSNN